jgi:small subunit ribosomal protein S20
MSLLDKSRPQSIQCFRPNNEEVILVPNIKSAEKRVRYIEKRTARNVAIRSSVKTAIRRFKAVADAGDLSQAQEEYKKAASVIDKAAQKGVVHRNAAARKKSSLAKRLNAMG